MTQIYETGIYVDGRGIEWNCVAQQKLLRMVCTSATSYTVASFKTFAKWGWKPKASPTLSGNDGSAAT